MYLKINTISSENVIEILDGNFIVSSKYEKTMARNESEIMLSWIDEIVGKKLSDLQGIIVCVGPGSYTGVRVGVTIANSMALALNIPIIGYKIEDVPDYSLLLPRTFVSPVLPYYDREPLITKPKARL